MQGLIHMTGGGFPENIPRVVPKGLQTCIRRSAWEVPRLFQWLQQVRVMAQICLLYSFFCLPRLLVCLWCCLCRALLAAAARSYPSRGGDSLCDPPLHHRHELLGAFADTEATICSSCPVSCYAGLLC